MQNAKCQLRFLSVMRASSSAVCIPQFAYRILRFAFWIDTRRSTHGPRQRAWTSDVFDAGAPGGQLGAIVGELDHLLAEGQGSRVAQPTLRRLHPVGHALG